MRCAGVTNAVFLRGHIEDIPLPDGQVDVVISNCVINLSADKQRVLAEAFRVLRPGGRLGISDVIADEGVDPGQLTAAEQRVGCVSGALTQSQYRDLLQAAGFTGITITSIHQAGDGLHSAIIQAARPASTGAVIAPATPATSREWAPATSPCSPRSTSTTAHTCRCGTVCHRWPSGCSPPPSAHRSSSAPYCAPAAHRTSHRAAQESEAQA